MIKTLTVATSLLTSAYAYTPAAIADQVTNLPGSENLNITFNQFSGYLTVGGSKNMHYWLVESMNDPASDPVAFWTNGGPGCSGLLGFFTEQGPFRPNEDMTLSMNEYAWNQVSNMVFIEAPCGVGFSYSDNKDDYTTGDAQTAQDNYDMIQAFFNRFPEYSSNDMYISSESYGGHYMPTLAKTIVDKNTEGANPTLNFKGFAVGNPYTDVDSGTPAMFATFWGHQLVAKPTYDQYLEDCVNAKYPKKLTCAKLMADMNSQVGNLNPYALDYPVCVSDSVSKKGRAQRQWFLNSQLAMFEEKDAALVRGSLGGVSNEEYQPCEEDYTVSYLNHPDVKKAMHVKSDVKWMECSYTINYNMDDSAVSTAPIYNYLIDGGYGLNILVYSGDDDSICGTVGTQNWIWDLGYDISGKMWKTYTYAEQTAGYLTQWENTKLGFLTVHGAGHEVPAYKPDVALDVWKNYLAGVYTNV